MLINELSEKMDELNILIEELSNIDINLKNNQKTRILKSAIILMMYNIIESMVISIFEYIHDTLKKTNINNLNNKNIEILIIHYFSRKNSYTNEECKAFINNLLEFPSFFEYNKQNKLFSGNLDLKKINDILVGIYGIDKIKIKKYEDESNLVKDRCSHGEYLKKIKYYRNVLAHGGESFSDLGKTISVDDILKMKDAVEYILNSLIKRINNYINRELYKKKNK